MYTGQLHYSVSCAHMPSEQKSETSTLGKRSVRSVVLQPARKALARIYQALLTGLANSAAMPLPPCSDKPKALPPPASPTSSYEAAATKLLHPALRSRESDEFSDDDPKAQHRLARFFPDYDPTMAGYKTLPSEVAMKLAEVDKRFSMESRLSPEDRRSYDSNPETLEVLEGMKHKRRDSGLSVGTIEDDVQVAKAVPLRRAVRKSFYPPARTVSR